MTKKYVVKSWSKGQSMARAGITAERHKQMRKLFLSRPCGWLVLDVLYFFFVILGLLES